jgi:hypothetical protein
VLCDWCDKGLRVVSVTQQIDFNGTVGKMLGAVLLGIAQMEQETRRERQAAGIAEAKKAGKYKGRKPGTTKATPNTFGKPCRDTGPFRGRGRPWPPRPRRMSCAWTTHVFSSFLLTFPFILMYFS